MHRTGDYVSGTEFSATNCLRTTTMYVQKIKKDLDDDNWAAIFDALAAFKESRSQEANAEAGLTVEEHEPLLPADPPSPPA